MLIERITLTVLAIIGIDIATYFLLAGRGAANYWPNLIPAFCRPGPEMCRVVLRHPDARLLGIPNALPGLLFYTVVIAAAWGFGGEMIALAAMVAAWVVVGTGVYLIYSLYIKVGVVCGLCMTTHGINLCIAVVLTFGGRVVGVQ